MNMVYEFGPEKVHTMKESEFKVLEDLLYYDGPLISVVEFKGEICLCVWTDVSRTANRWMIVSVEAEKLKSYKEGKECLRDIITDNSNVTILDITEDDTREYYEVSVASLPEKYLPKHGCRL